eukprot:jgi/Chrzof1/11279/Cz05g30120.t1
MFLHAWLSFKHNLTACCNMACSIIKDVIEGPEFDLVEAAAAAVCRELLEYDSRIEAVHVHVKKPHVAFPGPLESVGVELFRTRDTIGQRLSD